MFGFPNTANIADRPRHGGSIMTARVLYIAVTTLLVLPLNPLEAAAQAKNPISPDSSQQPFQRSFCTQNSSNCSDPNGGLQSSFQVPSDHRLVIEFISGSCLSSPDTTLSAVAVGTTASGVAALFHRIAVTRSASLTLAKFYEVSQSVRFYADAGTLVFFGHQGVSDSNINIAASCSGTISGYLVSQ
jgi:hypothetical protein